MAVMFGRSEWFRVGGLLVVLLGWEIRTSEAQTGELIWI